MRETRRVAAGVLLALLVTTSGCVGVLTGSESLTFNASQATVSDEALQQTDYAENRVEKLQVTENFTVAGQQRTVEVTNWVAGYNKSVDLGPVGEQELARFVVVSTPQVKIAGRTFNPLAQVDNADLVQRFVSQYDQVSNIRAAGSQNTSMLGTSTEVTKFEATTTYNGLDVDLNVHVTKVNHDGDIVIAVAVYPQQLDGEEDAVFELIRGVEHDGGSDADSGSDSGGE